MGLTIHYELAAPADCDAEQAHELVRRMRRRAQGFKQRGRVERVLPIESDREALHWAVDFRSVPHPFKPGAFSDIEIPADAGFLFFVKVGADCEPLALGLCHYPKTVLLGGKHYRTHRPGWSLRSFSKTQYASLHGWEHFRRCHCAVVDLLHGFRHLGLKITINDEGDYWPGQSLTVLRQNLDEMNGVVAATAGAMKDLDSDGDRESGVNSPIFRHRDFERLEAEGDAKHGTRLSTVPRHDL
jgi:hypothetical protein